MRERGEFDAVLHGMQENAHWARPWLFKAALPLWSSVGVAMADPSTKSH